MTSAAQSDWLRRRLVARFWCDRIRERLAAGKQPLPKRAPRQLTLPYVWTPKEK